MIKKYDEFLNKKLSDNLKGFNKDEIKQQFLNGELDWYKYYKILITNNLVTPTFDEITEWYNQNKLDIIYYCDYCMLKNYDIPEYTLIELKKYLINQYNADDAYIIDVYFGKLLKKLNRYDITLTKNEIIDLFNYKVKRGKIDIGDIINFNNQYILNLTDDEIFNIIGFEHSFNNANDFIEYVFNNFDRTINNKDTLITYRDTQKNTLITIKRYDKNSGIVIDINYTKIYKIFKTYFNLSEYNIDVLFKNILKKYYDFDNYINVSYSF